MSACAYCGAPATATVRYGRAGAKVPACALHKAAAERKNLYLPCVISADLESMAPDEQARIFRETYWADNITNAEWPVVLGHEGVKAYVRSKFKKKAAGWLMALARVAYLNPELFAEVVARAEDLYREQIRESSFVLQTLRNVAEQACKAQEEGRRIISQVWTEAVDDEEAA